MKNFGLITFVVTFIISSPAMAAKYDGGVVVRLNDDPGTCININQHKISLHLRRFLFKKDVGWFSSDKEAGLLLETAINAESRSEKGAADKISFPKMFKANVSKYKKGIVSLPFEQRLLHRFRLKNKDSLFTSVDLTLTVLKKKKKANFGVALDQLEKITKTIPASIDPFTPAFKYFVNYANSVVSESINSENNVDEALKDGSLVFSFSDSSNCNSDEESTGAIAVIKNYKGEEIDGVVDISKIGKYCIKHTTVDSFSLVFAKKDTGGVCEEGSYKEVTNPYSLFILNASDIASSLTQSDIVNESLARCNKYGIPEKECI